MAVALGWFQFLAYRPDVTLHGEVTLEQVAPCFFADAHGVYFCLIALVIVAFLSVPYL